MATQPTVSDDASAPDPAAPRSARIDQQQRQIAQQQALIEQQRRLLDAYRQDSLAPKGERLTPELAKRRRAATKAALCAAVFHRNMLQAAAQKNAYLEAYNRRLSRGALIAAAVVSRPLIELRMGKPVPDRLMLAAAPRLLPRMLEKLAEMSPELQAVVAKSCDKSADRFDRIGSRFSGEQPEAEKGLRF